jgi:hypothetical protein
MLASDSTRELQAGGCVRELLLRGTSMYHPQLPGPPTLQALAYSLVQGPKNIQVFSPSSLLICTHLIWINFQMAAIRPHCSVPFDTTMLSCVGKCLKWLLFAAQVSLRAENQPAVQVGCSNRRNAVYLICTSKSSSTKLPSVVV